MKKYLFSAGIIVLTVFTWVCTYSSLPDNLATHWGLNGSANDYQTKANAMMMLIGIMIILYILMVLILRLILKITTKHLSGHIWLYLIQCLRFCLSLISLPS